ncbi:MAG: gliding motility-associated C-terminal domain-containing protein [Bacteroidota bacterium]
MVTTVYPFSPKSFVLLLILLWTSGNIALASDALDFDLKPTCPDAHAHVVESLAPRDAESMLLVDPIGTDPKAPTCFVIQTAVDTDYNGRDISCDGASDGGVSAAPSGGTAPYTYEWSNSETTDAISGLPEGTYIVTVTDNTGCFQTADIAINDPVEITFNIAGEDLICPGDTDGDISLSVFGGTFPYDYQWDNGAGMNEDPSGLGAGIYTVTITDINMCSVTASAEITEPPFLTPTLNGDILLCPGDSDGDIDLSLTGGTTPYTYQWDNTATTEDLSGLTAGIYTVTVSDNNACLITASAEVVEPPLLTATPTGEALLCFGDMDGDIDLTVAGGTTPYTYQWDNTATTENLSGLTAGIYTVTVTDNNACLITASAEITEPPLLTGTATGEGLLCFGDTDGDIDLAIGGGTPPYTYQWDNGAGTVEDPTGLSAGDYNVTVTDNNGCEFTANASITEPNELLGNATGEALLCFGDTDGDITLTINGGTLPYTYQWDNGAGTDEDPTGLVIGDYSVTVTDNNGCSITSSASITQPDELTASAVGEALDCNEDEDGVIDLTVLGGIGPYTYAWSNAAGTDQDPDDLAAGVYIVTVSDNNACLVTASAEITEPTALQLTTTGDFLECNDDTDGQIDLTVVGGTPPYTYQWDNGAGTDEDLSGLPGGTFTVTVTDNNGCTEITSEVVGQPATLSISIVTTVDLSCFGDTNGQATTLTQGGTPPYTYLWGNNELTPDANALPEGLTNVTVTDNNGCTDEAQVFIAEPTELMVSISGSNIDCNGASNGTATVTPSGGTGPYTYLWNNSSQEIGITGVGPGNYTVTVTDNNGCTITTGTTLSEPTLLTGQVSSTPTTCDGGEDGTATVVSNGGTLPYTYTWTDGQSTPMVTGLEGGEIAVTVEDAEGCIYTGSVFIDSPSPIIIGDIPTAATPVNCYGGDNGSATVTPIGGNPPYTYEWNSGQTTPTATGLSFGAAWATITDASGCFLLADTVLVDEPEAPLATILTQNETSCFEGADGSITAVVTGGTPDYDLAWSNGDFGPVIFNLEAGNYEVSITDLNGCLLTEEIEVGQPDPIVIASTSMINICNGDSNGSITVDTATIQGGTEPFIFSLDGENYRTDVTFPGLPTGNYSLFVQDINGCESMTNVFVEQPPAIVASLGIESIDLDLGDSIRLNTLTNLDGPFTYSWSPMSNLSCLDCPNPFVGPFEQTIYTVTVTDTLGCTGTADVLINVDNERDVYIPNAFTPNDDGTNDVFMIFSDAGVQTVDMFRIFNRWGELVYQADNFLPNDPFFGWDGTFKGQLLDPSVFVYYAEITFVDGDTLIYRGDVVLVR